MEWSKLKNIIILLLAITNLLLLGLVLQEEREVRLLEREALENAVAFLNQRGIQLEADVPPQRMELLPQQVERQLEREQALAEVLLGRPVQVEALGGQVYRYTGPRGTVQFHNDGAFSGQLGPEALPRSGAEIGEWARDLLKKLDFAGEVLELQEGSAVLRQLWGQVPLLNHRAELHWDESGVRLSGRRLTGEPAAAGGGGVRSVPTALMDIFTGLNRLGDVCSQITRIQPSYVSMSTLHGFITLRPVWHITTDTGFYQLDTVSGQLSRAIS